MNIEEVKAFLASDEGATLVNEIKQPLLDNRDAIRGEKEALQTELSQFRATQTEQERIATEAATTAERENAKKAGDFDAYKTFHETEVDKYKTQVTNLKNKYAGTEVSRLIAEVAAKNSTSPKPLQLLLRERVSANYGEDGNLVVQVNDDNGQPMYFDGQPASISHLVDNLKGNEEYGAFFSASGASGSGTNQSDGDAATVGDYKDMGSENFNLSKAMGNK